jgi:DNA-binding protein HU-beta
MLAMAKKAVRAKSPAKKSAGRTAKPLAKTPSRSTAKKGAPKAVAKAAAKAPAKPAAEWHDMPAKQAAALLSDVFEGIVDRLKAGERVRIGGLGIIEVKNRPARMGRNPATGEAIKIKASKKVAFRAAKDLKDAI